ncbi:MAG: RNA polymerase sigma factor [Crocinitomicaceae bacterium]|nr:RNA polymerase sigma factor [Crocinitomicaceae bacterium]
MKDQEVIESVLNGDKNQFRVLIQRYEDRLFGLCLRMLQNRERAEDVLQESFIEIYRNLPAYKFKSSFSTWAYTITYRRICKEFKQGKKNLVLEEFDQIAGKEETAFAQHDDLEVDNTELLKEAIKTLSPLEQSLLSLYYYDDLNIAEISEITHHSEGKIKTVLFRLRAKLKQKINALRKEASYV